MRRIKAKAKRNIALVRPLKGMNPDWRRPRKRRRGPVLFASRVNSISAATTAEAAKKAVISEWP